MELQNLVKKVAAVVFRGQDSHNRFSNDVNKSNGRVNCMLLAYVLVLLTSYEHPLQCVLDQF